MPRHRNAALIVSLCVLSSLAGAQSVGLNAVPPPVIGFIDISATGTPITGVSDDSEHTIVTTIGNALFPAGSVRVASNGVAIAGLAGGDIGFTNQSIPPAGTPSQLPAGGAGYLAPFWDDLMPQDGASATTIYWQESMGVLTIMWKDIGHFISVSGQSITFEVQVFSNPSACGAYAQYLYPDTTFGGSQSVFNDGASATVGYVGSGGPFSPVNVERSFNSNVITAGLTLTVTSSGKLLSASSPLGAGSLSLSLSDTACSAAGSSYLLAVTLNQGVYPNGWLYGVDIPFSELVSELSAGAPFTGEGGTFALGPFGGLPEGLTFYAVVVLFDPMGTFSAHSNNVEYTIPGM